MRNVVIIGSGCAGNTAAVYTGRASLSPLVVSGHEPGGQLSITSEVENFPGFPDGVMGPQLVENMKQQAIRFGAEFIHGTVEDADLSQRPFKLKIDSEWIETRTLIIASGASARWLGLPNEYKLIGHGVSSCATCDGFFYRGKKVVVIGGGSTAVEEALFLTNFASHVTLIHRRDTLRAEKIMQDRLFKHPKIEVLWHHEVTEVLGDDSPRGVTAVRARNVNTGEATDIPCDGFFVAIGHAPASELVKDQLELHNGGYVRVEAGSTRTSIPGVFAAGDLTDHIYRQAVTSAGMGCMAALDAEKFLAGH